LEQRQPHASVLLVVRVPWAPQSMPQHRLSGGQHGLSSQRDTAMLGASHQVPSQFKTSSHLVQRLPSGLLAQTPPSPLDEIHAPALWQVAEDSLGPTIQCEPFVGWKSTGLSPPSQCA